jgi:glutamine synthetase
MRTLAANAGMAVTFMARPFADTTGSSCHLHLSLVDGDGRNVFHDAEDADGISATLRHAIGGVLERAPELMLFYAPTVNSYRRTTSGEFSGNGLSWGFDSRMVSCRVLTESPESTRLEWRVPGADVDPFLAIAALLASALDGIETDAEPGEPLMGSDFERPVAPLPATLGEAVERFRDGSFAPEVLGKDVVAHYTEAGRWEWEQFLSPGAVGEWERRRYFDVI